MERGNYIWINGEFTKENQSVLTLRNRSFLYGDGFFETIHAYGTEGKHLSIHFSRISKSLSILGMEQPSYLNENFLAREITRLLNKNRFFDGTALHSEHQ